MFTIDASPAMSALKIVSSLRIKFVKEFLINK
jgi:hypothetical protein